ncbi:MAG TPA: DCC1-like thiol-disulfide oxidoreductase family protein [Pyrinomonadaceae bacterium]|nr:DCC1-like thiol-disulfide oxidoreductase family protein [Pyrinomonadaceae bacterium]
MSDLIVLYDGVCGLCNRLNQFLLKRDQHDRLRFASLQSDLAKKILERHGADPTDLDTVYVVEDYDSPSERLFKRSNGILRALQALGGVWKLSAVGKVVPRPVRDLFYRFVASNRYKVFGKFEVCMMPDPKYREKFLDI